MASIFQSSLLVLIVVVFTIYGFGLAALYGALVSFSNTWLFDWYTNKQKAVVDADAQKSFRMAIKSSAIRMFSLAALTLIGLGLLEFNPEVFKKFVQDKLKDGATLLGGCCEIKPRHIKALTK